MKQTVNLLDSLPTWEKNKYPLKLVLSVCLGLIVILMSYYYYVRYNTLSTAKLIQPLEIKVRLSQMQITKLQKVINDKKEKQQASLKRQQTLFKALPQHGINGGQFFYDILNSFSVDIPPSVWLKNIRIQQSKQTILLNGHALTAQAAMTFVSNLNKNPIFAKTPFKLSNINNFQQEKYMSIQLISQPPQNK